MTKKHHFSQVKKIDGGYASRSSRLTIRDLKAIIEKFPDEMTVWVRYPSEDFFSETCSAISWVGRGSILSDTDDPPQGLYLQPLSPSAVKRNRDYFKKRPAPRT